MIELPAPDLDSGMPVPQAIEQRRSIRVFRDEPLDRATIGQLLWAAQGITSDERGYRAAPSAGATYPLETYLLSAEGVFRYVPQKHALEKLAEDDMRRQLTRAARGQRSVETAPISIVFAAVYQRTARRYGDRAVRYVHMEIGHAAQNVHLRAVSLGLGSVPVGAFADDRVAEVLDLPADHTPLYIIPVGVPANR